MKPSTFDLIAAVAWTIVTLYWIFFRNDHVGMILAAYSAIAFHVIWIMEKHKEGQTSKESSSLGIG